MNRGPHGKARGDGSDRQHRVAGGEQEDGEGKATKILVTRTFQELAGEPVRHPRLAGSPGDRSGPLYTWDRIEGQADSEKLGQ